MNPVSSRDENDSLSSTEEVSQDSKRTLRAACPKKLVCETDYMFSASSVMDPRWLTQKKADFPCSAINGGHLSSDKKKGSLNPLWRP